MVTRKELFRAVRSGAFVPFAQPRRPRDLRGQLLDIIDSIGPQQATQLVYCIITGEMDLPSPCLTPKERMFLRSFIKPYKG
jgi:hypothetical protein